MSECWAGFTYDKCAEHPGWHDFEPVCETCGFHFGLACDECEVSLDSVWNQQMDKDTADYLRIVMVHPATHKGALTQSGEVKDVG